MPRNRLSSHKIILNFCAQLKIDYDFMVVLIKPLLMQYCAGIGKRDDIMELVSIDGTKQGIRRRFIDMVKKPDMFSELDRTLFAYAVACSSWYAEKSEKLLTKMMVMVPDGKDMVAILRQVYLEGEGRIDASMQRELHMSEGTYGRRKKDAIALYGALIYEYALKREKEDIAAGLIDPPDYEL